MIAGQNKKTYLIIGAAVLLILIAIVAVLLSLRKPAAEDQETLPEAKEESTYGTLPEIKSPELNPVEKTNPFKDVYKNPFGE